MPNSESDQTTLAPPPPSSSAQVVTTNLKFFVKLSFRRDATVLIVTHTRRQVLRTRLAMADRGFISLLISRRLRRVRLCSRCGRIRLRHRRDEEVNKNHCQCRQCSRQSNGSNRQRQRWHRSRLAS